MIQVHSHCKAQSVASLHYLTFQAANKDSPIDITITQDSITIEDDSAEPQWFREIARQDEEDTGKGRGMEGGKREG